MPRHVAVVTTSRADFGHLHWPLVRIAEHDDLRVSLVVMGAHLSPEFGATLAAIRESGFEPDETIECLLSSDTDVGMAKTIGLATLSLADTLGRLRPDLLLLPADRYEMLAVASVALTLRIPIAHIEGGDISEGAIDDAVRNALTKMSHIHLTPTAQARQRVMAMGEEAWRVHRVGAPSLDHLVERPAMSREAVQDELGVELDDDYAVVAFHPVTLFANTDTEADALYAALERRGGQALFCFPNADAGSRRLIERAQAFCAGHDNARLFINLDHWLYWNLLRYAGVMIGNSSSGIMEAPSLKIPVVNIGLRQQGRERAANIIDAEGTAAAVTTALERADSPAFLSSLSGVVNPYGDGRAGRRIAAILAQAPQRERLLLKRALPLGEGGPAFAQDEEAAG